MAGAVNPHAELTWLLIASFNRRTARGELSHEGILKLSFDLRYFKRMDCNGRFPLMRCDLLRSHRDGRKSRCNWSRRFLLKEEEETAENSAAARV